MSPYFALCTVENNKNKKSVKFQGDMLNFCDFIQVFVFTRNHHLKELRLPELLLCWEEKRLAAILSSETIEKNKYNHDTSVGFLLYILH